jgi:cell division protein FtsB
MGRGPQPVRRQAGSSATAGGAVIVISAALASLFGGAGAWAYERFLAQPRAGKPSEASTSQGRDSEAQKNLARLDDRVNSLSDQIKQVQSQLESIPKPAPSPDLAPLEQKVARVDQLSQQVEAIEKKQDSVPQQLMQVERKITDLDAKLDELRRDSSAARDRTPAVRGRESSTRRADVPSPGEGAESAPPSSEKGESVDSALESGSSRFREARYREAYDVFRKLLQSHPDDARVWYYAALSYGLATGDWGKMTEVMAQEGVAREKAGKPQRSVIDSTFAGLTKETGKEWLDFYRRRAK